MPGSMPFHLEKGPYFAVVEDFCNGDANRLKKALEDLRDPSKEIPEIGGVIDSKNIPTPEYPSAQIKKHLYEDWFGYKENFKVGPQPDFGDGNLQTGYWVQYYGQVEKILRQTLIRAFEVALGIDHDDPVNTASRHWKLEFFWKCGQPWWEGWVTWRKGAAGAGQVTVVLATPGTGHQVLEDPTSGKQSDPWEVDPVSTKEAATGDERDQGLWLITHKTHQRHTMVTIEATQSGAWIYPVFGSIYEGKEEVVVVQTAEADGGVKAKGRKFVPA